MISTLLMLFAEFFKVGFFSFGGGFATIPFLFEISKSHTAWFTELELADMIAVSEATPGPVGINMATYCGYKTAGLIGAVTATFSLVLPAFIVIYILSHYMRFSENRIVRNALYGLKIAVVVLFLSAFVSIVRITFTPETFVWSEWIMFAAVGICSFTLKKVPPTFYIFTCGILSLFIF